MKFNLILLIFSLLLGLGCDEKQEPVKPNIILIMCDDLGWGDTSPYGKTEIKTPNLGRLAAQHFFGKDGTLFGIGLTGIVSVALTFAAICMADTSLSGFVPKSVEILVISLCTATVVLLVTSAAAQVLSMGFGPSLGLQLIFWNIVFLAQLATRFLMDFWKHV